MKNRIEELKARISLKDYVGKRIHLDQRGAEFWGCCPFHKENTASFAIKQKGEHEVFYCQGCGKGGDVIRFVEYSSHCTTKEAIAKLTAEYGIEDKTAREAVNAVKQDDPTWQKNYDKFAATFESVAEEKPKRTVDFEKWPPFEKALLENKQALDWLDKERGIKHDVARALHIGFVQTIKGQLKPEEEHARNKGWIMFPRIMDGKVVACKMRSIAAKAFTQWGGMDGKALFNVETINGLEPVFVVEGECDTAIMEQADFRTVSIPSASNHRITPDMKNRLKQASCIFLAGDNDGKVGNEAMQKLARELNPGAYILLWPNAKDANEFFIKQCDRDIERFHARVEDLMSIARSTPVEGFRSVTAQMRDNELDYDAKNDISRLHFPWRDVDAMNYSPAGSIVVIYSTYSGTGKSVFTTQVAVHEAKRGEVVVAFTPELARDQYLALLAAQNLGPTLGEQGLNRTRVTAEQRRRAADIIDLTYASLAKMGNAIPDFYNYRPVEDVVSFYSGYSLPVSETTDVLDFIEHTVKVTGATRFIIDTLHRITKGDEQTKLEGDVVKRLERIGQQNGTIFILIGQSNKEAENLKELRKDEYGVLRGSRELTDVAYGVYLLHRKKQPRAGEGHFPDDLLVPEAELLLRKDRGRGDGPAVANMLYQKKTSRFVPCDKQIAEPGATPPMSSANSDGMDADNNFA